MLLARMIDVDNKIKTIQGFGTASKIRSNYKHKHRLVKGQLGPTLNWTNNIGLRASQLEIIGNTCRTLEMRANLCNPCPETLDVDVLRVVVITAINIKNSLARSTFIVVLRDVSGSAIEGLDIYLEERRL